MSEETEIPVPLSPTVAAIYAKYEADQGPQYDSYGVPFSALGEECDRRIWYAHHWSFAPEAVDGQKLRLFETGKREEDRIIAELRGIGVEITAEQSKETLCGGHLRGKIECEAVGLLEAPATRHVLEIKTHKNVKFNRIVKHGVRKDFEKHYIQLMLGVHARGATRGMYIANCKNSDDIFAVRFHLDAIEVAQWLARAERIIYAERPPAKLHEDPEKKAAFVCKTCPARGVCHGGEFPRKNCRTCIHSTPLSTGDGAWRCERHNVGIPRDMQRAGCVDHRFNPYLVPGQQVDVDTWFNITYALHDGRTWKDDGNGAPV